MGDIGNRSTAVYLDVPLGYSDRYRTNKTRTAQMPEHCDSKNGDEDNSPHANSVYKDKFKEKIYNFQENLITYDEDCDTDI